MDDQHRANGTGRQSWKRRLFGDDLGAALFLGTVCLTWVGWHVGVFIVDTYTVANTLVALSEGQFSIDRIEYGLTLGSQPGLHAVDGVLYGRNYGQAALALPIYYALEFASWLVDLRLLVPGLWSLLLLAFARAVGRVLDRESIALLLGSVGSVVLFGANVVLATPFDDVPTALLALQILSMLAAGVIAVCLYRLVAREYSRRPGVLSGVGVVAATPLWFWAPIPTRHVLIGAAIAVLLFVFAVSRDHNSPRTRRRMRAIGYVVIGLVLWIHVFEGFLLLFAYGLADIVTAPSNDRREIATVGLVFAIAITPFIVTNLAISGNPTESPRLTPSFDESHPTIGLGPDGTVITDRGQTQSDGTSGGSANEGTSDEETGKTQAEQEGDSDASAANDDGQTGELFEAIGTSVRRGSGYLDRLVDTAVNDGPARLYHTYLRSGNIELLSGDTNEREPINLTLLESTPLFGTLLGATMVLFGRAGYRLRNGRRSYSILGSVRSFGRVRHRLVAIDTGRQTAILAGAIAAMYAVLYFAFLPLYSQLTVRYILPIVPALAVLLVRQPSIRTAMKRDTQLLLTSYATVVAVGVGFVALVLPVFRPAIGEAMQLHALVNLGGVVLLAGAVIVARTRDSRVVAVGLGVAAGLTTALVVGMQLAYFEYGVYALPVAKAVADAVVVVP